MRTVLYVSHAAWLGGAELSLFGLLSAMDRRRYRPILALPDFVPPALAWSDTTRMRLSDLDLGIVAGRLGIEVWRLPLAPVRRPRAPRAVLGLWKSWKAGRGRVAELVRRRRVHLIHANSPAAAIQCEGAPLLSHWRDWRFPWPLRWLLADRVAAWIVPSQALADRARSFKLADVRRVANGIDLDHFRPADESLAATLVFGPSPISGGDRRSRAPSAADAFAPSAEPALAPSADPSSGPVLMAAHQAPWKRHDLFLRALAWLRVRRPSTRARIAGSHPPGLGDGRQADLRRLAARLGVEDAVDWLGAVPYRDMPELYRSSSVLLHPAAGEPWGRSVAEAMACGVPVAAVRSGGPAEMLARGGGVLVDSDSPEALGRAALTYLDNPSAREAAGRQGRASARDWSLARLAAAMMDIYDQYR